MELPRNITQVGETDRNCKIYVEDYVISYMRQMNRFAEQKEMTIALYGKMSVEEQITYCFVYGACVIQTISKEVRHLSQAQSQEIEKMRRKYFPEQEFLGYHILNGDMIEGIRICDQNSCRYIKGYACFFEKNDTMLAYMLEARAEEVQPEMVEQDKYDMVKKRQEERRIQFENKHNIRKADDVQKETTQPERKFKVMPFMVAATGCLVCTLALGNPDIRTIMQSKLATWMQVAKPDFEKDDVMDILGEPIMQVQQEEAQTVMSTLVAEEQLTDALLEENLQSAENAEEEEISIQLEEEMPEETEVLKEEVQKPTSYVIQPGDTLIAISTSIYGDDSAVSGICDLNQITNPDNIQIGQKILLP